MRFFKHICFMLFASALFCALPAAAQTQKPEIEFAQNYIEQIRQHHYDTAEEQTHADAPDADVHKIIEQVGAMLPGDVPLSIETITDGTMTVASSTGKTLRTHVELQYHFPGDKWLVASVITQKSDDDKTFVTDFHVAPIKDSLQNMNRFSFAGAGIINYLFLAVALAVFAFVVYVLVLCIKTPMPQKKWKWIVFILIGFCSVSLNWNTGEITISPFYINILGAGFTKGTYAPLMIGISFPLGAVIFLLKRHKWIY